MAELATISSNSHAGAFTGRFNDTFSFVVVGTISGAPADSTPLPAIACTRLSGVSCGASENDLNYTIGSEVKFDDGVTLSVDAGTLVLGETFHVDVTTEIITDPTSADTDGDGVSDFDEIRGYCIVRRGAVVGDANEAGCSSTDANGKPLHGQIFRKTDPTNPDSDGDTAPDGLERRLGGDPTDPSDRDKFSDDDGDGLVNIIEKEGWLVAPRGLLPMGQPATCDTVCAEVEAPAGTLITSDPNNADTDDDGVIDGNEHAFKTNPRSKDTDSDGLTDREEILGLAIRDLGIIPPYAVDETNTRIAGLDPLDADTDNDRRLDGDEAKTPWIVRVAGANPVAVFSHPLISDEDLDKLVDGDESRFGSHPQKANTDGDRRDDYVEATTGLNPVQSDFRVTVVLASLEVLSDGDRDGGNDDTDEAVGEFQIQFGVKTPDEAAVTGVAETPHFIHQFSTSVGTRGIDYTHTFDDDPGEPGDNRVCSTNCYLVNILAGGRNETPDVIRFNSSKNFSFSMTSDQRFSIEGVVRELDRLPDGSDEGAITPDAKFGGFFDDRIKGEGGTEQLGVFEGSDLFDASKSNVQFFTYDFEKGEGSTLMRGVLKFFFIVD